MTKVYTWLLKMSGRTDESRIWQERRCREPLVNGHFARSHTYGPSQTSELMTLRTLDQYHVALDRGM